MLVLTRKVGESVVISEDVYCTIVGLRGDQIRLAFNAPPSIAIHREEIQRRIWREQREGKQEDDVLIPKESVVDRLIRCFKKTTHPTAALND